MKNFIKLKGVFTLHHLTSQVGVGSSYDAISSVVLYQKLVPIPGIK